MDFSDIYDKKAMTDAIMDELLQRLQFIGPKEAGVLELLAHIREADYSLFAKFEPSILCAMGLFYKDYQPLEGIIDRMQMQVRLVSEERYGVAYTPVQLSILSHIESGRAYSFSAPTSSGKSHIFRELIKNSPSDVVIVLPTRALIHEYVIKIREMGLGNDVMVMQYVEKVNVKWARKYVYVVTPERAGALFSKDFDGVISLFLFDEAQLSDSEERRGYIFDSCVKAVVSKFPYSKVVFAHPFVDNPEIQIKKYGIGEQQSGVSAYKYMSVGKRYVVADDVDGEMKFSYFSPYGIIQGTYSLRYDVLESAIKRNQSILVFVSKEYILTNKFENEFSRYIQMCPDVVEGEALSLIDEIEEYIGSNNNSKSMYSQLTRNMRRGVALHHGSMPLRVRVLVEMFVKKGFAKICFASPTLLQGVNMPFSLVFIKYYNFKSDLTLKNLIGRAGRSTQEPVFDSGVVIVPRKNLTSFSKRLVISSLLKQKSVFDIDISAVKDEYKELVLSIQERNFNYDYNLTNKQVNRLGLISVFEAVRDILDNIFDGDSLLDPEIYFNNKKQFDPIFIKSFYRIFRNSFSRDLYQYEQDMLVELIPIFILYINGMSLKEIVHARMKYTDFNFLNEITSASSMPCQKKITSKLFRGKRYQYDLFVFDTYDYIDKVINISLTPPLCAALSMYNDKYTDGRAVRLSNLVRYGTDESMRLMLFKYGFTMEDMEWLFPCVDSVDMSSIAFNANVRFLTDEQKKRLQPFMN